MKIHGTAKGGALSHKDYGVAFGKSETFIEASGGTETTDGDYKVHKFTSSGDFEVTAVGSNDTVQYIIVASGGGGGAGYPTFSGRGGGGAGAGGMLEDSSHQVEVKTYGVVIGAGGAENAAGNNSSFDSNTSIAGGLGGEVGGTNPAGDGGSGGGDNGNGSYGGGSGTAGQGNDGGGGAGTGSGGGAGGGKNSAGGNGSVSAGGSAGAGKASDIVEEGTDVTYATGGAGGASDSSGAGANGAANTGTGGSGGSADNTAAGGTGGSGIVVLRYKFQ